MVENPPNKKFIYIEDNGDGTSTITVSIPEDGIFDTVVLSIGFEEMFSMTLHEVPQEFHQHVADLATVIPRSPEEG